MSEIKSLFELLELSGNESVHSSMSLKEDFIAVTTCKTLIYLDNLGSGSLKVTRITKLKYDNDERVTCIFCLGLRHHDDRWRNVVILGLSSGRIEIRSDTGVIIGHRTFFTNHPILSVRPRFDKSDTSIQELIFVCPYFLLSVKYSDIAQFLTRSDRELSFKKLIPESGRQKMEDVLVFETDPSMTCLFDQLYKSTLYSNSTNPRPMTNYVTVGSLSLYQINVPKVTTNRLANVVATVTSSIFRVLSSAGKSDSLDQDQEDQEDERLEIDFCLKDPQKLISCIECSPNLRYCVLVDSQHHRVWLFDTIERTVIQSWKGYHHVRVSWIISSKGINLLLFYLPRRKIIQVWNPENKLKIVEFPMENPGLFLYGGTFLDLKTNELFVFHIPLSDVYDYLHGDDKFRKILSSFNDDDDEEEEKTKNPELWTELRDIISKTTSQIQQCTFLLQLFQSNRIRSDEALYLVESIRDESRGQTLTEFCDQAINVIEFKLYLEKLEDEDEEETIMTLSEYLSKYYPDSNLSHLENIDYEIRKSSKLLSKSTFGTFMSHFELDRFSKLRFKHYQGRDLISIFIRIGRGFVVDEERTISLLEKSDVNLDLLRIFFSSGIDDDNIGSVITIPSLKRILSYGSDRHRSSQVNMMVKNFFHHSKMTETTYIIMTVWIMAIDLHPDLLRIRRLVFIYLKLLRIFAIGRPFVMTFDSVFNRGNGQIASIVANWIESCNVDDIDERLEQCRNLLPKTFQSDIFYTHWVWTHWNETTHDSKNFDSDFEIISKIHDLRFRHRFIILLWNHHVSKRITDLIRIMENRDSIRHENELKFLEFADRIKSIQFMERHLNNDGDDDDGKFAYDCVSAVTRRDHLLEMILKVNDVDHDSVSVEYQIILVLELIWRFNVRFSSVTTLFSHRELYDFLRNDTFKRAFKRLFYDKESNKQRRIRFLRDTASRLVECIYSNDVSEYSEWSEKYTTLSNLWNLSNKAKLFRMERLYKNGYDTLGRDLFDVNSFEVSELEVLRSVAMIRLTKIVYESPDRLSTSVVHPEFLSKLEFFRSEISDIVDVPLRQTLDLFVLLCSCSEDATEMLDGLAVLKNLIHVS